MPVACGRAVKVSLVAGTDGVQLKVGDAEHGIDERDGAVGMVDRPGALDFGIQIRDDTDPAFGLHARMRAVDL
ncbi:hypothetical protein GCM10011608_60940 [Micromonospora sonchi]|uniref:Uncharacterized protein n=1 Tax=Micromonospora sonchi TaxID=1763543 RepID=A0A917X5K7_9ACTN|nr:hypothetical protein GCM10011608_60940 [Micromonospora sonchi]